MHKPVPIHHLFLLFISTVLLVMASSRAKGERIYPLLQRDSINKILLNLKTSKQDTNRVNMLLSLADYYWETGNDSSHAFMQQALQLGEQLHFKKGLALAHCLVGVKLFNSGDSAQFENEFKQAVDFSREEKNLSLEAYIWYKKAACFFMDTETSSATVYFNKSKQLYLAAGDYANAAYLLKCIADIQFRKGKPALALRDLFEVVTLYQQAGYKKLHYTYDLTGAVYKSIGNYEEALRYALLVVEIAEATHDTAEIGFFHMRLGQIYFELGDFDNALVNFQFGLDKSREKGDEYFYRVMAANIAWIKGKKGYPADALVFYDRTVKAYPANDNNGYKRLDLKVHAQLNLFLKNYALSEKYFLEMLRIANGSETIADLISVADFYVKDNKFARARVYLTKALGMVSVNSSFQLPQIHQLLFCVDSAAGDFISAIRHYQISKSISDSIYNDKKINQIASLQLKFNTEKKDQSIALLTSEKNEQTAILKQRIFQRNVMIVGAAVLFFLVWFIYSRYQLKNKTAQLLGIQKEIINKKNQKLEQLLAEKEELIGTKNELIKEKEWLVKEVHHRVKNNLQMVMTLLYTQSAYLKDKQALATFMETQHRIHAISLIHQKLYQSDNLEVINMKGYIHELVDNLKESFDKEDAIDIILNIEPLELDISKSIPIGLMLNESVTNALKYAFDNGSKKLIHISLLQEAPQQFVLTICDNGKGLPPGFNPLKTTTLGLKLIEGLCKQIKAQYAIESNHGVSISIRFRNAVDAEYSMGSALFENVQNSIS